MSEPNWQRGDWVRIVQRLGDQCRASYFITGGISEGYRADLHYEELKRRDGVVEVWKCIRFGKLWRTFWHEKRVTGRWERQPDDVGPRGGPSNP